MCYEYDTSFVTFRLMLCSQNTSKFTTTVLRSMRKAKDEQNVYPVIAGMAIGNPQYRCTQDQALSVASKCPGLESTRPVLERIYGNSRIGSRYFAVPDFTPAQAAKGDPLFYPADGSYEVRFVSYAFFGGGAVVLVCWLGRNW